MKIVFTQNAWEDLSYWMDHDMKLLKKVKDLITDIMKSPFHGIGKPEPLKHQLRGCWSRRINQEHRLIYQITGSNKDDQLCIVLQCRFHYR